MVTMIRISRHNATAVTAPASGVGVRLVACTNLRNAPSDVTIAFADQVLRSRRHARVCIRDLTEGQVGAAGQVIGDLQRDAARAGQCLDALSAGWWALPKHHATVVDRVASSRLVRREPGDRDGCLVPRTHAHGLNDPPPAPLPCRQHRISQLPGTGAVYDLGDFACLADSYRPRCGTCDQSTALGTGRFSVDGTAESTSGQSKRASPALAGALACSEGIG